MSEVVSYYEDFNEIEKKIWDLLTNAVTDRSSEFRTPVFICGNDNDLDGRVVVLRKADQQNNFVQYHSDIRSSKIEKIKKNIMKITESDVNVNIKEIKKPELNSNLVAENIAQQLVKRIAYRRAMKRAMQSAMRLNAKGIKVMLSGRLAGNEIARTEWLREGSIPSHTLRAEIDYGVAEALTTYGIIGVKVWIYKGELMAKDVVKEKKERVKNATASQN